MAEILYINDVSDGYDVRVKISDGRETFFHFPALPEDVQLAVDNMEKVYLLPILESSPPPLLQRDSSIEIEFKIQRDAAKIAAISFIYSNDGCSEADVIQATGPIAPLLNGGYLLGMYIQGAFSQGMIPEPTFEAFKGLVLSLTPDQLMEI